jgi:hypothetical protein
MPFSLRNTLALGAFAAFAAAQGTAPPKLDAACEDVVIFMSRGNDAGYGDGRISPIFKTGCSKFAAQGKSCDHIDIQFNATLGGPYCEQVSEGGRNGVAQITAFNAKCPCTHIVINGYSEGAHVAGDVLGGPGSCGYESTGLDRALPAGKAVAAALLWGDVLHTANQPWNVLDGADKQSHPRTGQSLARLSNYSPVLRSYCAAGDPVCAGGKVVAQHLNYFELYTEEATEWIVSKVNSAAPLCAASTSAAAPTPTVTSAIKVPTTLVTATAIATPTKEATTLITATATSAGEGHATVAPVPAPACKAVY